MDNKSITIIGIMFLIGIVIGLGAASAYCNQNGMRLATVDVSQIVNASAKITALRAEESIKVQELQTFVEKARADIEATKDEKKKKELTARFEQDITKQRIEIETDYANKLTIIDKEITEIISNKAKEAGIKVVLAKTNVIYGGEDITDMIVEAVK